MRILKSLTALFPKPAQKVRGIAVGFDGEKVMIRTFEGRNVEVPLESIAGTIGVNQVVTAKVREAKPGFVRFQK